MGLWHKLCRSIRSFRADRRGNVMITFALATLPIVGFTGFAVDYSHANAVKAAMQAALDSTALMLSKEAAKDTSSQLQTNATKYFNSLFTRTEATSVSITASYTTTGGSQILLNGTANVPTSFLGVIGYSNIPVTASSTAKWGSSRLRVALVLDNTGSMADNGKITALITATKNLLTQLQTAAVNNGDVYVSIIPFVKDVDVGSSNYNSNWIYWGTASQDVGLTDNNSWDANNGSCSRGSNYSDRGSCVAYPVCSNTRYTSQSSCQSHGNTWYTSAGTWTPANHNTWNGCVMDRGYANNPDTVNNYDTNAASPSVTVVSSLYAAEQYSMCPQAAMGLSYNWSGMTTLVNNMSPNGNTNQAIGLQLGWMSLVGGGPFTEVVPVI